MATRIDERQEQRQEQRRDVSPLPLGMTARRRSAGLAAGIVLVLMAASFVAGYAVARKTSPALLRAGASAVAVPAGGADAQADSEPPGDLGHEFDPFWQAWNFIEREYYHHPVDRRRLVQGAIKGMLAALSDPYASYLDSSEARSQRASLDGVIEGVGLTVEMKGMQRVILAPLPDSPAARAGLHSGDILLKVDGRDVGSMSLAEAAALLRGPAGTKVKLVVKPADDPAGQPVELELTRARIELESVSSRMVADGVGYVRIRLFGSQTVPQLMRALRDMRARRVHGLILDLRDNPGGYLSSAVDVASQFLKEGSVVLYEDRDGARRPSLARPGGLATDLTLAVLVNRGTASASEIVAGALRDHGRAVLIGEPTFGKGTVQLPKTLVDGSSVEVTVSTWLTPAGKQIQGTGLLPDVESKPSPEDEKAGRDAALEKALEWFGAAPAATPTSAAAAS